MTATTDLAVAVWPGIEPRLLRRAASPPRIMPTTVQRRRLPTARRCGSPAQPGRPVRAARPRRRGVPAGREAAAPSATTAAGPAERWSSPTAKRANRRRSRTDGCCGNRPHLVLDGLRLAARMVSGERALRLRVRCGCRRCGQTALAAIDGEVLGGLSITMLTVDPGYVAGEETAAVRAINGGPAKPTDKPPRPFEEGVGRLPDDGQQCRDACAHPVSCTDTARRLSAARAHRRRRGRFLRRSPARAGPPALYEIPHGLPRSPSCSTSTVLPADQVHGVLMGGYFAGLLNRDILDVTLDHESLRRLDSGLGCGAITDPHRGLPGGGRGVGDGVLRPRERRPVRVVLQRHGGDVGGDRGAARRGGHQRGSGPVGALVGGAARPWRLRDAGRRDEYRGQPAVGSSRKWWTRHLQNDL